MIGSDYFFLLLRLTQSETCLKKFHENQNDSMASIMQTCFFKDLNKWPT